MEPSTETLEEITRGRWQWKSNSDPWSESEEEKWESYPLDQNYLIEKAYYDQKKEVDIGEHIVFIKHKIQIRKGSPTLQRPIRRIDWMEEADGTERSERYLETELPKTINKVFGSLKHFLELLLQKESRDSRLYKAIY